MEYTIAYRIYVGVDNTAMETLVEEMDLGARTTA